MDRIKVRLAETTPGHYFDEMTEFLTTEIGKTLPGCEIDLQEPKTEELSELLGMLPEADVLVIGGAGQRRPVSEEVIAAGPKLRFVMKLGTRYHQVAVDAITKRGMPLAVEPAPSHMGVAEHALCLRTECRLRLASHALRDTGGIRHQLGEFVEYAVGSVGHLGLQENVFSFLPNAQTSAIQRPGPRPMPVAQRLQLG